MMQRHYGGVGGTRLLRGYCPECGRNTAGGRTGRKAETIWLKAHKRLAGARSEWCPGSGRTVPVDRELSGGR